MSSDAFKASCNAPAGGPPAPATQAANNTKLNTIEAKLQALEIKVDRIINHFGVK